MVEGGDSRGVTGGTGVADACARGVCCDFPNTLQVLILVRPQYNPVKSQTFLFPFCR